MGHVRARVAPSRRLASVDAYPPKRRNLVDNRALLTLAVGAADVLAITAAAAAVYARQPPAGAADAYRYACTIALFAIIVVILMRRMELFALEAVIDWREGLKRMVGAVVGAGSVLAALLVGFDVPRLDAWSSFGILIATTALALAAGRTAAAATARSLLDQGALTREVAILGATRQARLFVERLQRARHPGTRIIGVFDDRKTRIDDDLPGAPMIGDLQALAVLVRRGRVDDVVLALPWNAQARVLALIEQLRSLPVNVSLAFDTVAYDLDARPLVERRDLPALTIHAAPLDGWGGIAKAIEDRLLAFAALIALAPLMVLIAALIRIDSRGPVIFRQKRFGFNNEVIEIFKFRTMYAHVGTAVAPFRQARRDDPRVTRVGRLLRRTSLDELPQLVNVLQGRMSLVGPRPHVGEIHDCFARLIRNYDARHKIKPGITGWAQINGCRGETDTLDKMRRRVELDIWYVEHWSVLLDLRILLTTLVRGWTHTNAY
jgi:Undecaprenyl-phosphate glucose phosphotransferase